MAGGGGDNDISGDVSSAIDGAAPASPSTTAAMSTGGAPSETAGGSHCGGEGGGESAEGEGLGEDFDPDRSGTGEGAVATAVLNRAVGGGETVSDAFSGRLPAQTGEGVQWNGGRDTAKVE